jgi:hypothetical protein
VLLKFDNISQILYIKNNPGALFSGKKLMKKKTTMSMLNFTSAALSHAFAKTAGGCCCCCCNQLRATTLGLGISSA